MELGVTVNRKNHPQKAVSNKEIAWLFLAALVAFLVWIISTMNIPANPFGGLASELFLAETAGILTFYLIARSRSIIMAVTCFIALPTIQAILIYDYQSCFDWLFDIL